MGVSSRFLCLDDNSGMWCVFEHKVEVWHVMRQPPCHRHGYEIVVHPCFLSMHPTNLHWFYIIYLSHLLVISLAYSYSWL